MMKETMKYNKLSISVFKIEVTKLYFLLLAQGPWEN